MKILSKSIIITGMFLSINGFASDLLWDDMQVVPAIKIESNKFLSCKKEFSLHKKGGIVVPKEYYEKDYFCIDSRDNPDKIVYFTAQELAKEYIGSNVKAVGVMQHKDDNKPGHLTSDNVYVDLYYKNK